MRVILTLCGVLCASSFAFGQSEKSLGATKSFDATQQSSDQLWKPDEIEFPDQQPGEVKAFMPDKMPTIQEKRLDTPKGVVVFSQVWDISCGDKVCPTKVALISPGGQKKILLEDSLPQILPEAKSKSLVVDDQVTISDDLKTLSIKTDDGVQDFDLN